MTDLHGARPGPRRGRAGRTQIECRNTTRVCRMDAGFAMPAGNWAPGESLNDTKRRESCRSVSRAADSDFQIKPRFPEWAEKLDLWAAVHDDL